MKNHKPNLPSLIKAWRKRSRLVNTQEAADKIGLPKRTYENYEQGHRAPRGLALSALLERIK